jgi:hypothetical protein
VSAWLLADTKLRPIDHVVRDERGKLHTFPETEIVDADHIQVIGMPAGVKTLRQWTISKRALLLNYSHLSQQGSKLRPGFSGEKLPYFVGYFKQHIWKFSHSKSHARSSLRSYPAVSVRR